MTHHTERIYAFGEHPKEVHCPEIAPEAMFGLSERWQKEHNQKNEGVEPS